MRLWPRRAGGQLALLLILVLLVAQIITIVILAGERQGALRSASLEHVLQRVADGYTLADTTTRIGRSVSCGRSPVQPCGCPSILRHICPRIGPLV